MLPIYFSGVEDFVSDVEYELLARVEGFFRELGYEQHSNEVTRLVQLEEDLTAADVNIALVDLYEEHVVSFLSKAGIRVGDSSLGIRVYTELMEFLMELDAYVMDEGLDAVTEEEDPIETLADLYRDIMGAGYPHVIYTSIQEVELSTIAKLVKSSSGLHDVVSDVNSNSLERVKTYTSYVNDFDYAKQVVVAFNSTGYSYSRMLESVKNVFLMEERGWDDILDLVIISVLGSAASNAEVVNDITSVYRELGGDLTRDFNLKMNRLISWLEE